MNPALLKAKLFRLALRMNPQPGTLNVRTPVAANTAATDDGADAFTQYALRRLVSRELTNAESNMANATLSDNWKVWTVLQYDLDISGGPAPVPLQTLTVSGSTWVIERVTVVALGQAYECMARLQH